MRILIQPKTPFRWKLDERFSRSFAWIPTKCWDVDSELEFYVWLEPITKVYKIKNNKWVIDHYLINSNYGKQF
jgi:hypothetical protein